MDKILNQFLNQLASWFAKRPLWLQDAARRVIQKGAIDSDDLIELILQCKQEAGITDPNTPNIQPQGIPIKSLQVHEKPVTLRLEEISNVKGINALSPRKPLKFTESPLTIIYGGTGSGKSGYVRILKHACGAKKSGELHGNVFAQQAKDKGCTFKVNIATQSKELDWAAEKGVLDDIRTIEIYDTDCAHVYLVEENEVAYEPWLLSLFTQLTDVCSVVGKILKDEIDRSISIKPPLPAQLQETQSASWYSNLSHQTKQQEIDSRCLWNQKLQKNLTDFNRRLSEPDPAKQAAQRRKTKANLQALHDELKKIRDKLSDDKGSKYLRAKKEALAKRKAADEDAKKVFENSPLDGIGSESWRLLWEQARIYSETIAYEGIEFPNISEEAICVLCNQLLSPEAKERLTSFEEFVKGELQRQAGEDEEKVKTIKEDIEDILSAKDILLRIEASITTNKERKEILKYYASLVKRKNTLLKASALSDVGGLPDEAFLQKLKIQCDQKEEQAQAFDQDAKSQNRVKLQKQAKELEAQQWLSDQKNSIEQEVARLKHINSLEKAHKLTSTQALSVKKSSLADVLISPAFIKRFENELETLGASHIKVKLTKTRAEYGHVYHQIQLNGCTTNVCTTDVLSDGEFRIVSLAAFLADVEGQAHSTPFIFDDPITSVDQDFEEATAQRLINLCDSRQVIVFTHRLSLLALLEDAAKKAGIESDVICLRSESWGIGEPGETPIFAKKPDRALNLVLSDRLPKARKVLEESGGADYEIFAKGICTDIRILIERLIENDLLSDVVQRFRREVQTKNKIHKLAKIDTDDCKLLDNYMTKYSKYEHSHPSEAPVLLPYPDQIEKDLKDILSWLEDFKKR